MTDHSENSDSAYGRVLIVDDDLLATRFYDRYLTEMGFKVDSANNLSSMTERIRNTFFDFVLLDLNLGHELGLDGISTIIKESPHTRIYVLTSSTSVQNAVLAMQKGASGFFTKGDDKSQIVEEFKSISSRSMAVSEQFSLKDLGLIGESVQLQTLLDKIQKLRDVDSSVLILGESGTGKEVISRAIHKLSTRGNQKFVAINCGAIPEMLLEAELFGHKKGAFTDAKTERKGIFEICSEGTLLLDEIGDMPLNLQTKLLRVLQEREITPLGSHSSVKINTRVLAATHRDILNETRDKKFREDLYYRLSVIILNVPSLRERVEDIPLLVNHFIELFNKRFNKTVSIPSFSLMKKLQLYPWPGNIRELRNAIERGVVLSDKDQLSEDDVFSHLPRDYAEKSGTHSVPNQQDPVSSEITNFLDLPLTEAKHAFEKLYLKNLLSECDNSIVKAAQRAKRYRADIYRMLSKHDLEHFR